jgi:hypothetical protein
MKANLKELLKKYRNLDGKKYKEKDIPFKGLKFYSEPEFAYNRYSKVSFKLNPIEVAVYDTLMGAYDLHLVAGNSGKIKTARKLYEDFYKGKNWFIENNVEAYMTLID